MGDNLEHLQDNMHLTAHINSSQEQMEQLEHQLGQVGSVLMGMIEGAIEREGLTDTSSSEAGMSGVSGDDPDDQGRDEDSVGAGASTGESMKRDSPMLRVSLDIIFACIFRPFSTQLHFTFLTPPLPLMSIFVIFLSLCFHTHKQTTRTHSIGTTGHQTTCLLGYRHSETVLLWFLLTWILCWNLLCRHRMLPPLKVPDFLDTEHK